MDRTGAHVPEGPLEVAEVAQLAGLGERGRIRVALVGTGYLGGSFLLALGRAGLLQSTKGYDVDPGAALRAVERGIVDQAAASAAEAVVGAELVVLAVPVGAVGELVASMGRTLEPACLVTDLGSTKAEVVRVVETLLPRPERFVGGHPIAGREHRGPDAADATLFEGRRCLLTPTARTLPQALAACARLWRAVGAEVSTIDAALHDRVLGLVSHLPHAAAFALGAAVDGAMAADAELRWAAAGLWGGGFADTTRIAASNPAMWRDVMLANRDGLLALVDRLVAEVAGLRRAIAEGDGEAIVTLVERAGRGRVRVMGERGK